MKLRLLSDLHLEMREKEPYFHPGSGDILVLAGDILTARHLKRNGPLKKLYTKFLEDCSSNFQYVLWVDGNHHFYGYTYESTPKVIIQNLPKNFTHLQNSYVQIEGINFIGSTLWSDFRKENPLSIIDNGWKMNDYKTIRISKNYRKLSTEDTLSIHKTSVKYLDNILGKLKDERNVVITHHAPSLRSIAQKYKTHDHGAYCSDLEWLIVKHSPILMCHGHTHQFFDYSIESTRIICNPFGYPNEETEFRSDFEVEL